MLQSMGLQRVGHDWVTEQQESEMQLAQIEDFQCWTLGRPCFSLPRTDSVHACGPVVILNSTRFTLKSGPNMSSNSLVPILTICWTALQKSTVSHH